jgi:hypothetical protein
MKILKNNQLELMKGEEAKSKANEAILRLEGQK